MASNTTASKREYNDKLDNVDYEVCQELVQAMIFYAQQEENSSDVPVSIHRIVKQLTEPVMSWRELIQTNHASDLIQDENIDIACHMPKPIDILTGKVKKLNTRDIFVMYFLIVSMCNELRDYLNSDNFDNEEFHKMFDNFLNYMMDNFEEELVILGAKIALNVYLFPYKFPVDPRRLTAMGRLTENYGKYI